MTMAWIDHVDEPLITWLSSAQALPDRIAVCCLTFDVTGHISLNDLDLDALLPMIAARTDTRWLLSVSNADEAAFTAVRDNTNGAKDALLSDVRSLRSSYPLFKGLDIRLTSASDSTHWLAVRELIAGLFLQYKHAYAAGHFNLTLPVRLESGCSWEYYASFVGYFNTVSLLFQADDKMEKIEAVLREAAAWYPPGTVFLALPGAGRMYTAAGAADVPFSTTAGFLLGTARCADGQPYAAFSGYLDTAEYRTVLLPHVFDYASGYAIFQPRSLIDMDGNTLTPDVTVYYSGRPVITQTVSATFGNVVIVSDYTVLISEFVIGDPYKYDAHEYIRLDLSGQSYLLGRVNRTGAVWNGSVFTLSGLAEEPDSRAVSLEGHLECLSQGTVEGIVCGSNAPLTVTTVDSGAELVMACLGDSRGCAYLAFRTSLDLQELYNHAVYDLGIGGLALDGLGAEDPSFWNLV